MPQEPVYDLYYKTTRVVGIWPARLDGDVMVRQCGPGPIDGAIVNAVLESTTRVGSNDNSLGPGDTLITTSGEGLVREFWTLDGPTPSDWAISDTESLKLQIDCADPLPDATGAAICEGTAVSTEGVSTQFRRLAKRDEGRDVVFLVDVSGSTSGMVDATSRLEYPSENLVPPASPEDLASDSRGYRWDAVKTAVKSLGEADRIGVLAFGEEVGPEGLAAICRQLDAQGQDTLAGKAWAETLEACFTTDKSPWLDGLKGSGLPSGAGRSNLWQALLKAHEFLKGNEPSRHKHIVVITDGPDTCGATGRPTPCAVPCQGATAADEVVASIAGDSRVSIHFVQFDSRGYVGPDAKQIEVACLSGGHHRFINRVGLPTDNPAEFQQGLYRAVEATRLAMMGTWQVALKAPAFGTGQTQPGTLYALAGNVSVEGPPLGTDRDVIFFKGGEPGAVEERPILRKGCDQDSDCISGGVTGDCMVGCSDDGLCMGVFSAAPQINGVACGSGGSCCTDSEGATMCLAAGESCDTCP